MTKWLAPLLLTASLTEQAARDTKLGLPLRREPTVVGFASYPLRGRFSLSAAVIFNTQSELLLWNGAITFTLKKPR